MCKTTAFLLLLLSLTCGARAGARGPEITLAEDGTSRYRIVLPTAPTPAEARAATVLQDYLLQITGAALPILPADRPASPYEIVLGLNERVAEAGIDVDFRRLEEDGFAIKTAGTRLVIAGGTDKGTLYGVYGFLEEHLGCRMYSATVKHVPKQPTLTLGPIDDVQVPVIRFRDTHYRGTNDPEYTDWHRIDHDAAGQHPDWGMWVHTFNRLVPPDVYYRDHPEYYALVDGKRLPTQLCLTNPAVLDVTVENLRREIMKNPAAVYWSVSQNDNRSYCTCDRCRALDEREGSPSGSILAFVNQVAEHFPDKVISTLAYEYSRQAPRTLRPRDNVNIMLCSIEVNRDRAIPDDSTSADFRRDVEAWGQIAKDILVWDYVIQFRNLVSPFPNLHVLQPNIRFFADNGVTAMFEQGNREVGGEFAELRAYLIAKLLWNPEADVDALMNDFLQGYYGAAARPIRAYIDRMRQALLDAGQPLRIFGSPNDAATSYLTPALIAEYEARFDEAEAAVAGEPELLERVRIARLPLTFAVLEQAKKTFTGERGLFERSGAGWRVRDEIRRRVDPFVDLCTRAGVTRLREWSTPPEEYRSALYRLFAQGMNEHLAYGKTPTFLTAYREGNAPNGAMSLTDGIRGSHDYTYNWLYFTGQDVEVVVDLEAVQEVRRIESAYYQHSAGLMLMPSQVEYFVSVDGERFERVGSVANDLPIDQYGAQQRDFTVTFAPRPVRYVKVKAHTIGNTPDWHDGAGRPATVLVDEIVVE